MSKWRHVKLSDVFTDQISGEWGRDCTDGEIGTKVLRTTNFMNSGDIDFGNVVIRKIEKRKVEQKKLSMGDIILEKSGGSDNQPVGRVVYFNIWNNTYLCNNFTLALRVNSNIAYSRYVFYFMFYKHKTGYTELLQSKTTGIRNLQVKQYMLMEIPLPPLDIQKQIADTLDKASRLIELRKTQLEKMDLLVKSRFVELFDVQKCQRKTLGECTDFVDYRGHTPELSDTGTIRMVNAKSVGKGFFKYVDEYVTEETYDSWMHRGFGHPGDILFVTEGHTFGNTCLIPNDLKKFALGQRVITIKGHQELLNAFLCSYMQTDMFWKDINVYRTGGTAQGIRSKDLVKVFVPIPPLEQQKHFAAFVEQTDKSKFEIQRALNKLETLYNSLMHEYFG